jgi:hypothetical protein
MDSFKTQAYWLATIIIAALLLLAGLLLIS